MPAQTLGSPTQSTPAERRVDVGVGFGGPTANSGCACCNSNNVAGGRQHHSARRARVSAQHRRLALRPSFARASAEHQELDNLVVHDDTRIQLAYSTGHLGRAQIMPMLQPSRGSPKFSASQASVSEASATRTSA